MFQITSERIDACALAQALQLPAAGACVSFDGRVRDHHQGRVVLRLEYEAYRPMAEAEGGRILAEARERFPILDACCRHRVGLLEIGECAVWIGVLAAHRQAAFQACEYIIDQVKARVPIWKKEFYADAPPEWVFAPRPQSGGPGREGEVIS